MPVNTFDVQAAVTVDYGIYTAEVQQVDDNYKVGMPKDWERPPELQGDAWGFADGATDRMRTHTA